MIRTFAGGRLFGSVTGTATPRLLALHGWGRSHRDFDRVLAPDGEKPLPAIALDLPGFGVSPPPDAVWGAEDYARSVAEVLDDMEVPVVLLGHSFGGRVALHLAAQRPHAVGAMVLTGAPFLPATTRRAAPALGFRMARRLHALGLVSDARMETTRLRYGSADYNAAVGIMRLILVRAVNESDEEQLTSVRCPVHLVWGADDTAAPVDVAERALGLLSNGELSVEPGTGHLTPTLIPEVLRAAVMACLP
jgi:pimeloyl-ACP methyl ester carboxylesterase